MDATEDEIKEQQEYLIVKFIKDLPNKYDAIIGENGIRLSGGEKQRPVARAMLKKVQLSCLMKYLSLDSETEEKFRMR